MKKSYEIDMTSGPLLGKILLFSIPLMLSGILQLLFNAADIIVVGRFAGSGALAAVGSTSSLINLLINVFVGLSVGVNVLVARYYGARKDKDVSETVHTAVTTSIVSGFILVVLGMGVDGVAWATVISEHISAFLVLRSLMSAPGALKLDLKQLRIHPRKLKRIVKIGLPAGMQGAIFSISNVLIQSSVNSFGSIAMAGNTASSNIEGFVYTAMNAVYQTNLSFTSQNLGGRKYSRINKIMYICLGVVTAVGLILGLTAVAAGDGLLHIYSSDPEVLHYGMLRLEIICTTYFLCGIMDCMVGSLRGLGYSIIPMFVSLTGACGFRVLWVFTVFAAYRSLDVLYLSYPVSWAITAIAHMVTFHKIRRKIPRQDAVSM